MRILFVATVQSHIAQFHMGAFSLLKEYGWEIHVAARDNLKEKNGLKIDNADKVFNIAFDRSPFSSKNIKAYKELKKVIDSGKYDAIHCNTPVGGLLARLAGKKARKNGTTMIYTAHGFHFYKGAPKKNWIIFYPIEKFLAHFTDKLITITDEDYKLASEKFNSKIYHVHGVGIKSEKYDSVTDEQAKEFRAQRGCTDRFIILCTGELNANKNQCTLIKAMPEVLKKVPEALLVLAGNGPKKNDLEALIKELNLEESIRLIGYHADLEWYVHACDIVATASFREGLPLNVVEAMYCNKPVIASNNRGHRELISDKITGRLVNPRSEMEFARTIVEAYEHKEIYDIYAKKAKDKSYNYVDTNVKEELKEVYGISMDMSE